MSAASLSSSKRFYLQHGECEDYDDRPVPTGKRVKYSSNFNTEDFSPPPAPSCHFRSGRSTSSPSSHVYNSCFSGRQDRGDDTSIQEEEEGCMSMNSSPIAANTPNNKKFINEYFELGSRGRITTSSSAMEQVLAGAPAVPGGGGGSVAVCGSCSAELGEEDLMQEQDACYFCSKRGCRHCMEKCIVCQDRFCSNCSIDVYSYSYNDERICIDCNCDNPTTCHR